MLQRYYSTIKQARDLENSLDFKDPRLIARVLDLLKKTIHYNRYGDISNIEAHVNIGYTAFYKMSLTGSRWEELKETTLEGYLFDLVLSDLIIDLIIDNHQVFRASDCSGFILKGGQYSLVKLINKGTCLNSGWASVDVGQIRSECIEEKYRQNVVFYNGLVSFLAITVPCVLIVCVKVFVR